MAAKDQGKTWRQIPQAPNHMYLRPTFQDSQVNRGRPKSTDPLIPKSFHSFFGLPASPLSSTCAPANSVYTIQGLHALSQTDVLLGTVSTVEYSAAGHITEFDRDQEWREILNILQATWNETLEVNLLGVC